MKTSENLIQAVKEYKAGKKEAFEVLYKESERYIYTCIFNVVQGNPNSGDLVSEIMHETYLEILKSIHTLKDEESFLSWAGTIANHKCSLFFKKNKKYVLLEEEDKTFEQLSDSEDVIPETIMQNKEKQRLLKEIIDTQLTDIQRFCIYAYYYHEQKQSEIAQELGVPENTVKTHLYRAKAKIEAGVNDLEKNKNTRLYNVSPLLLLLFREDVSNTVVPEAIRKGIVARIKPELAGVAEIGKTGAKLVSKKGLLSKAAAASIKTKVISGAVALTLIGSIATVAVFSTQKDEASAGVTVDGIPLDAWKEVYTTFYAENPDKYEGFLLHDFDADGAPELICNDGQWVSMYVCGVKEIQMIIENKITENGVDVESSNILIPGMIEISLDSREIHSVGFCRSNPKILLRKYSGYTTEGEHIECLLPYEYCYAGNRLGLEPQLLDNRLKVPFSFISMTEEDVAIAAEITETWEPEFKEIEYESWDEETLNDAIKKYKK